jgi:phosphatidylglycerol lysyltransferase
MPPPSGSRLESAYRWRRIGLSLAVAFMGIVDLLSALLSRPPERLIALLRLVPTEVIDTSRTFTLLAGALLLATAWGLRHGKRRAFVAALFLCAVSVPVNLLKAIDFEEATVATTLMFLLGVSSDSFRVRSRGLTVAGLRWRALWAALALVVYVAVGSWVIDALYGYQPSLSRAFADAGYRMFGIGEPVVLVSHQFPHAEARVIRWYLHSLPVLSFTLILGLALAALRPARHRGRHRAEAGRVAELIRQYGDSSVSAFALAEDTDYFFSSNGRAVIAYRFESDTLLVIGDPIGPPEELNSLLDAFATHCRQNDWQFAFFQARPEYLDLYRAHGWPVLHLGEDPILWTDRFTLEGAGAGDVRRSVRKAENKGLVVRHFLPGEPRPEPELVDHLRTVSNEWLRARHGGEKGFCMGRFDPKHLDEVWLAVAWNPEANRVEAFATWERVWARRGWALDLARRRNDSAPGVMEFLIERSVAAARERGDSLLSLSLSALARADEPEGAGVSTTGESPHATLDFERAREFLMEHLARFYDFKGLFRWKKKFQPSFEPRYLVYPGALALPRVALALVRAQSPGGLRSYFDSWFPSKHEPNESADSTAGELAPASESSPTESPRA